MRLLEPFTFTRKLLTRTARAVSRRRIQLRSTLLLHEDLLVHCFGNSWERALWHESGGAVDKCRPDNESDCDGDIESDGLYPESIERIVTVGHCPKIHNEGYCCSD